MFAAQLLPLLTHGRYWSWEDDVTRTRARPHPTFIIFISNLCCSMLPGYDRISSTDLLPTDSIVSEVFMKLWICSPVWQAWPVWHEYLMCDRCVLWTIYASCLWPVCVVCDRCDIDSDLCPCTLPYVCYKDAVGAVRCACPLGSRMLYFFCASKNIIFSLFTSEP